MGELTPLTPALQASTLQLLEELPTLYSSGEEWLERKMGEIASGQAEAMVVLASGEPVAVVILTPKNDSLKISTLFVAEAHRGQGLGRQLLTHALQRQDALELPRCHITVASVRDRQLAPLLLSFHFEKIASEAHRYGPGRHENIYSRSLRAH